MVGAIGGLVEIGLHVWGAFRGDKDEEAGEPTMAGDVGVEMADGSAVPLPNVLKDHEDRLQALERSEKRSAKKAAPGRKKQ